MIGPQRAHARVQLGDCEECHSRRVNSAKERMPGTELRRAVMNVLPEDEKTRRADEV
jgi:hypothetical protein